MIDTSAALPWWTTPAAAAVAFGTLVAIERRRPLRRRVEPSPRRLLRNAATGGLAQAVALPLQLALVGPLAVLVEQRGGGILQLVALPPWLALLLGVVLLDYTLWQWHWLNHHVPALWRFHSVHHADVDLDASTALRFHFGEMLMAAFWRALQVVVLGVGPLALSLYTALLFVSVLFHHSNVALPRRVDRALARLLATPRLHGIHHSVVPEETNSNFASLLTAWDALHRTLRMDVRQADVTIGPPGRPNARPLTLREMLLLPFARRAQ